MKVTFRKHLCTVLLLFMVLPFGVEGCGTFVGNPDDEDDSGSDSSSFFPTVDFDMPSSVSGLSLRGGKPPPGSNLINIVRIHH